MDNRRFNQQPLQLLVLGVSLFSCVCMILITSSFSPDDSRAALAQFANTTVVQSFNDSGILVSNVSETGLLPEIIVQPKEPDLGGDDNLSDSMSSLADSLEPSILDTEVSSLDNTSTYLIELEPNLELEMTAEEHEMLAVPESPGLIVTPPAAPAAPAPPPTLEDELRTSLNETRNDTNVDMAEPNEVFEAQYEEALADYNLSHTIKQAEEKQAMTYGFDRIDGEIALNELKNNSEADNIDIAILDSGISPHPDLNLLLDKQVSFTGTSPVDNCNHGTHVAGIAAAKDNDFGIVGTAPGARLWNVKVLDGDPNKCYVKKDSLIKGLGYVAKHADEIDVVNMSVGGFCDPNARDLCNSPLLEAAIDNVKSKGVVVIVAGGNKGDIPGRGDSVDWKPAKFQSALTVSNLVDSDGKCGGQGNVTYRGNDDFLANNSNYGQPLRVAAPGVNVLSTSNNGSYAVYSGTSMAAPYVAGAAATYKSLNPSASVSDVIFALLDSSVQSDEVCDGEGFGYIRGGDKDNFPEPVLNMRDLVEVEE